jgi:two-component system OmpR family response regulator
VLLVDDDPVILRVLELNFRLEGFDVSTAAHGAEALERVRAEKPDAVILDVMMPGLDGYEVASLIRGDQELSSTRLVFLTARTQDDAGWTGEAFDDVDRMSKPFDPIALVRLVRSRVEATEASG